MNDELTALKAAHTETLQRYLTAREALRTVEAELSQAQAQADRRRAHESFRSGSDCNWCGVKGRFTQYVVVARKPTGERICTNCARRHQVLRPATYPARSQEIA